MVRGAIRWWLVGLAGVVALGCKKAPPPESQPAAPAASSARASGRKAPKALLQYCETVAVAARGRRSETAPDAESLRLPVVDDDPDLPPAERRLRALEAIDELKARLEDDPRAPRIHHRLGVVFRDAMRNPDAARAHFCRALLQAPRVREYRLSVIAMLMRRGAEPDLELALRHGDRTLPWRDALTEAKGLRSASPLDKAEAFEFMVRAQRMIRTARSITRRRIDGRPLDLEAVLEQWAGPHAAELRIAIAVPWRHRGKVSSLRNRGRAPAGVFGAPGPSKRWLVHGERGQALDAVRAASEMLRGVDIGVSAIAGRRQVYLVGRFKGRRFTPRYLSMDPADRRFEAAVVVPPPEPAED